MARDTHTVRITSNGLTHAVHLDDVDISRSLIALDLSIEAGAVPTMTLRMPLYDITELQDTETKVLLDNADAELLKRLGWTPPADPDPATPGKEQQ